MSIVTWNEFQKEIEEKIMKDSSFSTVFYTTGYNYEKNYFSSNMNNIIEEKKMKESKPKTYDDLIPKRVIFNDRATIVFWPDGTKTVVRCAEGEKFIPEVGVAMCIVKKVFGNKSKGREMFLRKVNKGKWQENFDKD